jgi:cephalosporin hydroxylase
MTFEVLKRLDNSGGSNLGDYKFLYGFISLVKPRWILDIGTCYGLSAIVMAMALRDFRLEKSKILTIDINHAVIERATTQIHELGLSKYVEVRCCTSSALDSKTFFDVVFIDGDHTYEGCMLDFNNVKDKATYILIHDSCQHDGVKRAMKEIKNTGLYEFINIDIGGLGTQWSRNRVVYRSYPGIALVRANK